MGADQKISTAVGPPDVQIRLHLRPSV